MNAHFELASQLLDAGADPNADLPGYTVLHAIAAVRNPGVGDNDPRSRRLRQHEQPRAGEEARGARAPT